MTPAERTRAIIADTARDHGIPLSDLLSPSRFKEHVRARHEAIRRVREAHPDWSVLRISRLFERDNSTVRYALGLCARKPKDWRAEP